MSRAVDDGISRAVVNREWWGKVTCRFDYEVENASGGDEDADKMQTTREWWRRKILQWWVAIAESSFDGNDRKSSRSTGDNDAENGKWIAVGGDDAG